MNMKLLSVVKPPSIYQIPTVPFVNIVNMGDFNSKFIWAMFGAT